MKCKNCNEETIVIGKTLIGTEVAWCKNCGTVLMGENANELSWLTPNSVDKTKQLVSELIKARDKQDLHIQFENKRTREAADIVNWEFNER